MYQSSTPNSAAGAYLEQEVLHAHPAKLRLMLIEKAIGLCRLCEGMWQRGDYDSSLQWTIRIRDILTELLSGITSAETPVSKQTSDLYVFLSKQLTLAEQTRRVEELSKVTSILMIEQETWQAVLQLIRNGAANMAKAPHIPLVGSDKPSATSSIGLSLNA